jgi:GNAT superfamily N-acetyltransferase
MTSVTGSTGAHELTHAGCLISDVSERLDVVAVHAYLTTTYWAEGISREVVAQALANSVALGIYTATGEQIGLVRVVSDCTTFAYLCDVYVLPPYRGRGLARAAVDFALKHPRLQNLRRWHLLTRDAHGLYAKLGFSAVTEPHRHMEKRDPDVYRRTPS